VCATAHQEKVNMDPIFDLDNISSNHDIHNNNNNTIINDIDIAGVDDDVNNDEDKDNVNNLAGVDIITTEYKRLHPEQINDNNHLDWNYPSITSNTLGNTNGPNVSSDDDIDEDDDTLSIEMMMMMITLLIDNGITLMILC
jgi:hypothetical protein